MWSNVKFGLLGCFYSFVEIIFDLFEIFFFVRVDLWFNYGDSFIF